MSCIGKYQRNVLNFTTTVKLALAWGFFPIFRQFVLLAYERLDEQVSPQHIFNIDTVLWILFSDVFYIYLNLGLKRRAIPSINEVPRPTDFSDLSKNNLGLKARGAIVANDNERRPPYPRISAPNMVCQGAGEGTSETGVFERLKESGEKRLPQKFSYFPKLLQVQPAAQKPKPDADICLREEKLEIWDEEKVDIWGQALGDSERKILFYSRHMDTVNP